MAARSSTLGLSMPSTVPDCSSMSFWPGSEDQRITTRSLSGASPQYSGLAAKMTSWPRRHSSSVYWPVPLGLSTMLWSGTAEMR